jgi:adenylylsulfate kinase
MSTHIHPETETRRFLQRFHKERLLRQRGMAVWLCGLSGSGKSTIAAALEKVLHDQGHFSIVLDGDLMRSGLNADLGFSDVDRLENIRRTAEVAKLLANQGVIVIVSLITPRGELRDLARGTLGEDYFEVYVKANYETCRQRDPKGLYAKAEAGEIPSFTGLDSAFEPPNSPNLVLDTEHSSVEDCTFELLEAIRPRLG